MIRITIIYYVFNEALQNYKKGKRNNQNVKCWMISDPTSKETNKNISIYSVNMYRKEHAITEFYRREHHGSELSRPKRTLSRNIDRKSWTALILPNTTTEILPSIQWDALSTGDLVRDRRKSCHVADGDRDPDGRKLLGTFESPFPTRGILVLWFRY